MCYRTLTVTHNKNYHPEKRTQILRRRQSLCLAVVSGDKCATTRYGNKYHPNEWPRRQSLCPVLVSGDKVGPSTADGNWPTRLTRQAKFLLPCKRPCVRCQRAVCSCNAGGTPLSHKGISLHKHYSPFGPQSVQCIFQVSVQDNPRV